MRERFGRPLVVVGSIALFAVVPLFAVGYILVDLAQGEAGWPLRIAFLNAADAILDGESPYPAEGDPGLAEGTAYVYPPVVAEVLVPLTFVPEAVAVVGFGLVLVGAVFATLYLLGVRDWRCYGLALLWPAVLSAVHVENITILMGLAAALVWRFRDRPVGGGIALGVSIAVKPLLWPLGAWLLATRSFRLLAWSAASAVSLLVVSWAAIRFAGLLEYESLLRDLSDRMDEFGYSVYAIAHDLGAGDVLAKALWLALALGLLAASYAVARRGDERRAFVLGVAAIIACSPIVWLHYFALLVLVVAVAQPRLGVAWFVPFLMFGAEEIANGSPFQTATTVAAAALTIAVALYVAPDAREREPARRREPAATTPLAESP
jgi:arabinofuranan 3-O-arabinosyltransferase